MRNLPVPGSVLDDIQAHRRVDYRGLADAMGDSHKVMSAAVGNVMVDLATQAHAAGRSVDWSEFTLKARPHPSSSYTTLSARARATMVDPMERFRGQLMTPR